MYTVRNFRTKKELKEAVAANLAGAGPAVGFYQAGPFGGSEPQEGTICCEGPHSPEPHCWYATCEVKDGKIIRVK